MTEIIVRSRQGGKTTELIRRSAETGAYIVCTDTRRGGQVMRKAREMGLSIPMPLTVGEWQERAYYPHGVPGLLFDDLDRIVQLLSPVPVLAATWTEEAASERGDAAPGGLNLDELTEEDFRRLRLACLEYTDRNGGLMSPAARLELEELRAETGDPDAT